MEKVKIAVVGCGSIGKVQALALKNIDECEICALYNRHLDKAQALAQELDLKVPIFDDFDNLLASNLVQAVTICTSPDLHCSMTLKALEHNLHVIVEKPMAKSVFECEQMIELAKKKQRLLSVICQNRYRTIYQNLKALYEKDLIGKVCEASVESLWWRGQHYYDPAWRGTWQVEGGGCLMSHAIHQLDLMLWILGRPKSVEASMYNFNHQNSECEDEVHALFHYPNFNLSFVCSLNHHQERQEITIHGEKGLLSSPFKVGSYVPLPNGYPQENTKFKDEIIKAYEALPKLQVEGHQAQLQAFIEAILGKRAPEATGEEGRDALMLVTALYKTCVLKEEVSLPLDKDDEFCFHDKRVKLMPHFHEKKISLETTDSLKISLGS